jgi:hypothetical protein
VRELALDQADVDLEVGDPARDLLGVRDVEADERPGLLAHVARHQRHRDVVADGEGRADASAAAVGVVGERASRARGLVPHRLGARAQRARRRRSAAALADAVEEPHVELRSRSASEPLTADCDMASSSPARLTLPVRATARKTSSCRRRVSHIG